MHLTVAGEGGAAFGTEQLATLKAAIDAARDPNRPFLLADYTPAAVAVSARVLRDPAYTIDDAARWAREALEAFLAFDARRLGEPLHASNVLTALQAAQGVRAVDLEHFHLLNAAAFPPEALAARLATLAPVQPHLLIQPARPRPADADALDPITLAGFPDGRVPRVLPAELAVVEDASADLVPTVVDSL